jgi:protein-L-isoaspartate(D-aspartate) O-methyltransferase
LPFAAERKPRQLGCGWGSASIFASEASAAVLTPAVLRGDFYVINFCDRVAVHAAREAPIRLIGSACDRRSKPSMLDLARARKRMVDCQVARRGIHDNRVLEAMRRVPREAFVEPGFEEFAYQDRPLPIGQGQTISQPYIVALTIEAAELKPGDSVLEVGCGSGYVTAVMAQIADRVYGIERHPSLAEAARERFRTLGYGNVDLRVGDGTRGWPEAAPFDAIIVSAGSPTVPPSLKSQLAVGGRLLIPVGPEKRHQDLLKLTRKSEMEYEQENLGGVVFVPLIGEDGWAEKPDP